MANVQAVTAAGRTVRDGLQNLIDSGDFPADDVDQFTNAHLLLVRRLGDFALRPGAGQDSPAYDSLLTASQAADAAVRACRPDPAAVAEVVRTVAVLNDALEGATANRAVPRSAPAVAQPRGFTSALAVRRTNVAPAPSGPRARGALLPESAAPLQAPTEPYLTSLAKLFPAESLTALLLVLSINPQFAVVRHVLIAIIVVASGLLRYFTSRDPDTGKSDPLAVGVSVFSFVIYAAAMLAFGVLFNTDEATTRIIATVVGILWIAGLTAVVRKMPV